MILSYSRQHYTSVLLRVNIKCHKHPKCQYKTPLTLSQSLEINATNPNWAISSILNYKKICNAYNKI